MAEGECKCIKDGKQVHGQYGVIESGESFGGNAVVFDYDNEAAVRSADIIASKPCVVYRLRAPVFHDYVGEDVIQELQKEIRDIQSIIDVLSGVDTKMSKGTVIRQYKPSGLWLWRQWTGTILQYVWKNVIIMMVCTAIFGIVVSLIVGSWDPDAESKLLDQIDLIAGWWGT